MRGEGMLWRRRVQCPECSANKTPAQQPHVASVTDIWALSLILNLVMGGGGLKVVHGNLFFFFSPKLNFMNAEKRASISHKNLAPELRCVLVFEGEKRN